MALQLCMYVSLFFVPAVVLQAGCIHDVARNDGLDLEPAP